MNARITVAALVALGLVGCDKPADSNSGAPAAVPSASPVDAVGRFIVQKVAGRTVSQLSANPASSNDWLGIKNSTLLHVAGAQSFVDDPDAVLADGQMNVDGGFGTPSAAPNLDPQEPGGDAGGFDASNPKTPDEMAFAFNVKGVCWGGYVSGDPSPHAITAVDMSGKPCTYRAVQQAVVAAYQQAIGKAGG